MLETQPRPRLRRSRRIAAAVAAVLALAVGAAALHRLSARGATDLAQIRSHSHIPWGRVGTGWTLLQESDQPAINRDVQPNPDQLLLMDQRGTKYRISTLNGYKWRLVDWDHRHQQALLVRQPPSNQVAGALTDVLRLDLRTGVERRFAIPDGLSARYGDPDGQSLIVNSAGELAEYDLTGRPVWRLTAPQPPFLDAGYVSTPNSIVTGSTAGLNVYDATSGRLTGTLPAPDGFGPCALPQWQGDGKLTARCAPPHARSFSDYRPFVFSAAGAPTAGRTDPQYPAGWTTVTGLRDGSVAMTGQLPYLGGARLARVDAAGRTTPTAIPAQLTGIWWIVGSSTDDFLVAHIPTLGPQVNDRLVRWNPFTGKVVDLFQTPGQAFINAVTW